MSFLGGIVNVAKDVLGISSSHDDAHKPAHHDATPARSQHLAATTPTAFHKAAAKPKAEPQQPTLAERLQSMGASSQLPASSFSEPHLTSSRSAAPPMTLSGEQVGSGNAVGGAVAAGARADVADLATGRDYGTVDQLGSSTSEPAVAVRNVQKGLDYYAQTFGRNGVDGAGSGVQVLINDRTTDASGNEIHKGNGGYYQTTDANGTTSEAIHFGVGEKYAADNGTVDQLALYHADDLTIHELTHGIIRKETGQLGGQANEAGATNEGIADVMAASATRDWVLGEGMFASDSDYREMRNIADPDDPTAIHGLWTSVGEVQAKTKAGEAPEEHWASGVVSTAAYRIQQRLGGEAGWQAVERVFYDSIDNDRLGDMSFQQVGAGLRASAASVYGAGSTQAQVFDEELRRGGL
jgi:hypothetical protein